MKTDSKKITSLIFSKTVIFIFVIFMVSAFKSIFKPENSLIGVTSTVLILALLTMDLTINPIKNLFRLITLNLIFGLGAFVVTQNVWLGLIINFASLFFIGYFFSYELRGSVSMLIGLHYILMVASPITIEQLPLRLISLVASSFLIMGAQLIVNKNKLSKSRKNMLNNIEDNILLKIDLLKENKDITEINKTLTTSINQLKTTIFNSGKTEFHLTKCGKNTINLLSCLEKINIILDNINDIEVSILFLNDISEQLGNIKTEKFSTNVKDIISKYKKNDPNIDNITEFITTIETLNIQNNVPCEKKYIDETSIPEEFKYINIQKRLINIESARVAYGIRLGLLVSLTFFATDFFNIKFGQWMVYTVFALTQPHLEYTYVKSKKRAIGTIIGSIIIFVIYSLIKDASLRTIILIAVGYLMGYVSDYKNTVIFVTISSIASASLYVINPGYIVLSRLAFVLIGVILSLIANKFMLPRKFIDEEVNLNNIQKQASKMMVEEVLFNKGTRNESVIENLYLVPSLIEQKIEALEPNGLKMEKEFLYTHKLLMNDLHQFYLIDKLNNDFNLVIEKIKTITSNSNNIDTMIFKIKEDIKYSKNIKETILLIKVLKILDNAHSITNNKEAETKTDFYQFLAVLN